MLPALVIVMLLATVAMFIAIILVSIGR